MSEEVPIIRTCNLRKSFGSLQVLRGLDVEIPAGQVVSLIGPSGSGKSTLLRILMTLERPDEGRVEIEGQSLFTMVRSGREMPANEAHMRPIRLKVGMVFQHFNLFPHMTATDNVALALRDVLRLPRDEARQIAHDYLDRVGLGDKRDAWPANLSGGQKQRVAIARAMALRPRIMLFDEITSALDPELIGGVLALLRELADAGETTMLIVTHQMKFARECSDRILFFDHGVILEDGHPDQVFTNPVHDRTREFLTTVLEA